uniref:Gag-Pol polyprotein n=1 Tax=Tanacetum cinerariifolium TaxID=118510 RepID=A0A6L2LAT8_TANCI|nr:Gag-Pol polyprotein [Tanacetum cinerariifolium]
MAYTTSSSSSSLSLDFEDNRSDKGYHVVPPPLIGNYISPKRDLRLIDEHFKRKNNFGPPIIEDWHSDDDSEDELSPTVKVKIIKPSVEKIESVKTAREIVKTEESPKQHKHHPRGNQKNWNNLMSHRLGKYYATSSQEVLDNSAANTHDNEHTSSSSLIVVEEDKAPQIVSSSAEQVATKPNSLVLNENADEFVQENVVDFDGNMFYNAPPTPLFKEAESSSTYQDPSNMREFHQKHRSSDRFTKNHPIKQAIGDLSKPVMIRNQLQTDAKVCMYALTVSTIEPKNIKEAVLDASWIESMQDQLNQCKHLDVWKLFKCPFGKNMIAVKWIWKNKTDAENTVIQNKSRLVAKGYRQEEGIDFKESFAPV